MPIAGWLEALFCKVCVLQVQGKRNNLERLLREKRRQQCIYQVLELPLGGDMQHWPLADVRAWPHLPSNEQGRGKLEYLKKGSMVRDFPRAHSS